MPIFYRGAGLGTYWHMNDARITGFTPHYPGAGQGISRVLQHIARGTTASPYVSLTRSFGVAWGYAMAGKKLPSVVRPAYVYEIEIDETDGLGTRLLDPVTVIANSLGSPYEMRTYHHDGDSAFLLGLVDPVGQKPSLRQDVRFAPPGQGSDRSPLLHIELEALVRSLRDAEILSFGAVAAGQIRRRIEIR